jgi:AraC-like DNA-binding protein
MELNGASPRLTAASIAAAVGCSRSHLYRAFSASGTSVAETMREIGLNRAKRMLDLPRPRSLAEIAREAGYTNESSFCRAFRAATGMTPGDYRTVTRKTKL